MKALRAANLVRSPLWHHSIAVIGSRSFEGGTSPPSSLRCGSFAGHGAIQAKTKGTDDERCGFSTVEPENP